MTNEHKEKIWDVVTAIVMAAIITAMVVLALNACTNVYVSSPEYIGEDKIKLGVGR